MSHSPPTEGQAALLIQRMDFLQKEIDQNKREAEIDLRRVKEESEEEIRQVREKADADNKRALAQIAALEDERTKALKWGVMTLGTAVMGMGVWIANKIIGGQIQ